MSLLPKTFLISLIAFLVIYLLRGFGLLAFLPGGIILVLFFISLFSSLAWGIQKTRKY